MKTNFASPISRRMWAGSALLMTVILALALGLVLGSYLYLTGTQTNLVADSQAWNAALAYAEAGIEEGMAQVNVNVGKFGLGGMGVQASTNYSASILSNYGSPVNGVYGPITRLIGDGSYTVSISNDFPPTIYATGSNMVASIGRPITRTVQVKTSIKPLFGNAIASILGFSGSGNVSLIDAYDSSDSNHSTNQQYYGPWALATADMATPTGTLTVQNTTIRGHLLLGPPPLASYTMGSQGIVGDMNWTTTGTPEPGWVITDFNQDFPDVTAPYTSGVDPTYTPGNNMTNYTLQTDYYINANGGNFTMGNKDVMEVTGNARLYAPGGVTLTTVYIDSGASLRVYVGSASGPSVTGSFQAVNLLGNAMNFQVYGLPSMNQLSFSGNGTFLGTFYAPEAALTLNGGGNGQNNNYQGACVVQALNINGHFELHFDQNLKRNGPASGFTLANWTEL